ncbi:Protein Ycf2, partial [Bienertia sinuspersici]
LINEGQQFKSRIFELWAILIETKNSHNFLDSWTQFDSTGSFIQIFSHHEWFNKQSIFHDQACSTLCGSGPYISDSSYTYESIGSRNDTLEISFGSSNINRLIVLLIYLPKGKNVSCLNRIRFHGDGGTRSEKRGILVVRYLMKSLLEFRSHSNTKISNIWSFPLYIVWMIRSTRTMIQNCLIIFLFFKERIETELDLARQCVVGKQGSIF